MTWQLAEEPVGSEGVSPFVVFPDPFEPSNNRNLYALAVDSRRWVKQLEMRSRIRAEARSAMAEHGFEGAQLRSIAGKCGISVQTIYNLIGDRPRVLQQASEEWVAMLENSAQAHAAEADISTLLAIVGTFWASPLFHSGYVRSSAKAARTNESPLHDPFRKAAIKALTRALLDLRARNLLREHIDERRLSHQLASIVQSGIYDWTTAPYDVDDYWRDFENGPLLMIASAVRGCEIANVEQGADRIRDHGHATLYRTMLQGQLH